MNEYYKKLPRKRMAAGAIFLNDKGEVLIVKPSYKDHWSMPGGIVDSEESPRQACIREVREEIGLKVTNVTFLCVDYTPRESEEKDESLQFLFFGGTLDDKQISGIRLDGEEIVEYRFVSAREAEKLLSNKLAKRLPKCLEAVKTGTALYLESGDF